MKILAKYITRQAIITLFMEKGHAAILQPAVGFARHAGLTRDV
ncbi:MAG TPA: hypothetical protein VMV72_00165 [Verrucomicrobiae bacterium]|nr:hypothetical protein [Verrucomicrobiae bacterium]